MDKKGESTFSSVIKLIDQTNLNASISIYPNPSVKGNTLSLVLKNVQKGNYVASVLDINGKRFFDETITYNGLDATVNLTTTTSIPAGVYWIELAGREGKLTTSLLIK